MVTQVGGVGVGAYLSLIGRRRGCGLGVGGKHFLGKLQHMGIRSRKKTSVNRVNPLSRKTR